MTDIVKEARELVANATPGPWEAVEGGGGPDIYAEGQKWPLGTAREMRDAALIAAAPRLLSALADECERLRRQNSEYHRRAQVAEAAVIDESTRAHRAGHSVGRSLANASAAAHMRECERLRAENARLREVMPSDDVREEVNQASAMLHEDGGMPATLAWLTRLDAAKGGG